MQRILLLAVATMTPRVAGQTPCAPINGSSAHKRSACPPGKAGEAGDGGPNGVCTHCLMGQFQRLAGQAICFPCLSGTFQNETGQTMCQPCRNATFSDSPGAIVCKTCPRNKYPQRPAFCLREPGLDHGWRLQIRRNARRQQVAATPAQVYSLSTRCRLRASRRSQRTTFAVDAATFGRFSCVLVGPSRCALRKVPSRCVIVPER